MHKVTRPADADKIANLAQHPKRLGIAGIEETMGTAAIEETTCR